MKNVVDFPIPSIFVILSWVSSNVENDYILTFQTKKNVHVIFTLIM